MSDSRWIRASHAYFLESHAFDHAFSKGRNQSPFRRYIDDFGLGISEVQLGDQVVQRVTLCASFLVFPPVAPLQVALEVLGQGRRENKRLDVRSNRGRIGLLVCSRECWVVCRGIRGLPSNVSMLAAVPMHLFRIFKSLTFPWSALSIPQCFRVPQSGQSQSSDPLRRLPGT